MFAPVPITLDFCPVPSLTPTSSALEGVSLHSPPLSSPLAAPPRYHHPMALELPEILGLIGRFITQRDALSCVLVCRAWHVAFQPVVWGHVETANDISPQDMVANAHYIKSLGLADMKGLEPVLEKCRRLETLILWPDAFEDEEDEEDEDEDEGEESEGEGEVEEVFDSRIVEGGSEVQSSDQWPMRSEHSISTGGVDSATFVQPKTPPPHPMDPPEFQEPGLDDAGPAKSRNRGLGHLSVDSGVGGVGGEVGGGRDTDKVRRDSGVGEDSTIRLSQDVDMDLHVASLGVSESTQVSLSSLEDPQQDKQRKVNTPRLKKKRANTQLTNLLLRNPNLTRIEVYVERKSPGGSFWHALAGPPTSSSSPAAESPSCSTNSWTIIPPSPFPRLSTFQSLVNLRVHKHIKPFLRMCQRLETLDLEQCSLLQLEPEFYTSLSFPRLLELKFGRIRDTSLGIQLLWMRQCRALRLLEWRVPRLGFPVKEFCEAVKEDWKDLVGIVLPESRLGDEEMARILRSASRPVDTTAVSNMRMVKGSNDLRWDGISLTDLWARRRSLEFTSKERTGLTRFEVRMSDFGAESFRALKEGGHFKTLKNLDLFQCAGLDSLMTAEILKGCPLLESFDGYKILARDIVMGISRYEKNLDSGPRRPEQLEEETEGWWACKGIKFLDLHITGFAGDPEQDLQRQWQVFSQLAKLEKLVYLSIGGRSPRNTLATMSEITSVTGSAAATSPSSPSSSASTLSSTSTSSTSSSTAASTAVSLECYGLDLRLRSGMGQLETLKTLRMLRFTGTPQNMTEEDVEWMLENLPELKVVQGRLHSDTTVQDRLEKMLEQGKVSAWSMYNQHRQPQQQQQQQQQRQHSGGSN